jgi:hypothetical protein
VNSDLVAHERPLCGIDIGGSAQHILGELPNIYLPTRFHHDGPSAAYCGDEREGGGENC